MCINYQQRQQLSDVYFNSKEIKYFVQEKYLLDYYLENPLDINLYQLYFNVFGFKPLRLTEEEIIKQLREKINNYELLRNYN